MTVTWDSPVCLCHSSPMCVAERWTTSWSPFHPSTRSTGSRPTHFFLSCDCAEWNATPLADTLKPSTATSWYCKQATSPSVSFLSWYYGVFSKILEREHLMAHSGTSITTLIARLKNFWKSLKMTSFFDCMLLFRSSLHEQGREKPGRDRFHPVSLY